MSRDDLVCPICYLDMFSLTRLNTHLDEEHTVDERNTMLRQQQRRRRREVRGGGGGGGGHEQSTNISLFDRLRRRGSHSNNSRPLSISSTSSLLSPSLINERDDMIYQQQEQQHLGVTRNLYTGFRKLRDASVGRLDLEINRLLTRLEKLQRPPVNSSSRSSGGSSNSVRIAVWTATSRRAFERSIVPWQDDKLAVNCRLCEKSFNRLLNRKHHCRLCGHVMCGDDGCNIVLPAVEASRICDVGRGGGSERSNKESVTSRANISGVMDVRICSSCHGLLLRRVRINSRDKDSNPPIQQLYIKMSTARQDIELRLPRFNELFNNLCLRENVAHRDEAQELRASLLKLFEQFDFVSKHIMKLPMPEHTVEPTEPEEGDEENVRKRQLSRARKRDEHQRVRTNIRTMTTRYLQDNMLTLQALPPKCKQKSASTPLLQQVGNTTALNGKKAPASLPQQQQPERDDINVRKSMDLDEMYKVMDVLHEQKDIVQSYIRTALEEGRMDDVKSLRTSLWDLEKELEAMGSLP